MGRRKMANVRAATTGMDMGTDRDTLFIGCGAPRHCGSIRCQVQGICRKGVSSPMDSVAGSKARYECSKGWGARNGTGATGRAAAAVQTGASPVEWSAVWEW